MGKKDIAAAYLILGVENQSDVHYAMPVRDMLYDALQYMSQVETLAERHEAERKLVKEAGKLPEETECAESAISQKKPNAGEFLSGFYKEDRLCPVITVVVHFGSEKWDGARTLHEMLAIKEPKLLAFVPDYKLNLLSPADMTDEELNRFTTSLREVMLFIKYAKDKTKLIEMLQKDEGFQHLDRKAVHVINTVTGAKLEVREEEEDGNMCQALEEFREDVRAESRKSIVLRMLERGRDSFEEIAELTDMTLEEVRILDEERQKETV